MGVGKEESRDWERLKCYLLTMSTFLERALKTWSLDRDIHDLALKLFSLFPVLYFHPQED